MHRSNTSSGRRLPDCGYVRYAPTIRRMVFRAGFVMLCASGLLALLPVVAQRSTSSPLGYGILLGCFGAGAILGALAMHPARPRWSIERVVSVATVLLGVTIVATGVVQATVGLAVLRLLAGGGWIVFISFFSALVQTVAPEWVRARVLAVFMLIFQGGTAAGSALWGLVGQRAGIETALLWAGVGTILTAGLGLVWRLPSGPPDISPWNHWRMPVVAKAFAPELDEGPVLVTVEYDIAPDQLDAFLAAMQNYERVRRSDGASRWGLYRDMAIPSDTSRRSSCGPGPSTCGNTRGRGAPTATSRSGFLRTSAARQTSGISSLRTDAYRDGQDWLTYASVDQTRSAGVRM